MSISATSTRLLHALVLVLLGTIGLSYYFAEHTLPNGDQYAIIKSYLSPTFQLATLIGAIIMIAVALFLIATLRITSTCGHDHGEDESCEEDHVHGEMHPLLAIVLLAAPIFFSLYHTNHQFSDSELSRITAMEINPEILSSDGDGAPQLTKDLLDQYIQKNAKGAYRLGILEIFSSGSDPNMSSVLDGVTIEVEAAVRSMPGDAHNPKIKRAYRLMMQCCAADMQAIPVKLHLTDELANSFNFPEHTWVRMEATISYETDRRGYRRVVLTASSMEKAKRPSDEILISGAEHDGHKQR